MTYLIAFAVPTAFAIVGFLVLRDIDYWLSEPENPMLDQLYEIRGLPETRGEAGRGLAGGSDHGASASRSRPASPRPFDRERDAA